MNKPYKVLIFSGLALTIIAILIVYYAYPNTSSEQKILEIDFLDIGQGDSVLIKTPHNQNILIDGGADSTVIRRLTEELSWYDRTIDLMILSHPHDDQSVMNNATMVMFEIVEKIPVKR